MLGDATRVVVEDAMGQRYHLVVWRMCERRQQREMCQKIEKKRKKKPKTIETVTQVRKREKEKQEKKTGRENKEEMLMQDMCFHSISFASSLFPYNYRRRDVRCEMELPSQTGSP